MRRRDFIALLSGAFARPFAVRAQQSDRKRLIGVLWAGVVQGTSLAKSIEATFVEKLRDLGWKEDHNVQLEHRWTIAGGAVGQTRALARELVALQPDVIVVNSSPLLATLISETKTIPIVFVRVADPVGQGFIPSLARPGGNVTGFTNFESAIGAKWLQLLKELSPDIMRVAVLFNPNTIPYGIFLRSIEAAAPTFGVGLTALQVSSAEEIERALLSFSREPKAALLVLPDIFTIMHRRLIIDLAARFSLPAVYPYGFFAQDGGLASYGIDAVEVYRDAATYVDRILRGAKPSELPVQASTTFELIVNLKTAQALGLTVPPSLLARADAVLE